MAGIYVFYQGENSNGQLRYSVFDLASSTWGPDTPVPNVGISFSPSAVAFPAPAGAVSVFHQGAYQDGKLYFTYFDGTTWRPDTQLANVGIASSPSAVAYTGGIAVFHQGLIDAGGVEQGDGQLWYSYTPDGANWTSDMPIPNVEEVTSEPSAVVFPGGGLSVFHQRTALGGNDYLWYTSFDGTNWTTLDAPLFSVFEPGTPSAIVLPAPVGAVSVFHQGTALSGGGVQNDGTLWYTYFDGTNWVSNTQVPNVAISGAPSAVVF